MRHRDDWRRDREKAASRGKDDGKDADGQDKAGLPLTFLRFIMPFKRGSRVGGGWTSPGRHGGDPACGEWKKKASVSRSRIKRMSTFKDKLCLHFGMLAGTGRGEGREEVDLERL